MRTIHALGEGQLFLFLCASSYLLMIIKGRLHVNRQSRQVACVDAHTWVSSSSSATQPPCTSQAGSGQSVRLPLCSRCMCPGSISLPSHRWLSDTSWVIVDSYFFLLMLQCPLRAAMFVFSPQWWSLHSHHLMYDKTLCKLLRFCSIKPEERTVQVRISCSCTVKERVESNSIIWGSVNRNHHALVCSREGYSCSVYSIDIE